MNKIVYGIVLLALAVDLTGCASVQKKFTRKKKEPRHVAKAIAFEEGQYQRKFSNEYYYKMHFTYWKAWHGEWIDGLSGNRKRSARNAQEALSHLEQMADYLVPEKAQELDEPLVLLGRLKDQIETGQTSGVGTLRVELERWRRILSSNFYYDKIKDHVLPDTVDLGEAAVSPPAAAPAA